MGRSVLVTGCSSGIGYATARRFAADGWTVYATARDPTDLTDLEAVGCRTAELDVTDQGDVDAVVARVHEECGALDCLVNNAGYGQVGPVEDVPMAAVRNQFDVNTFGPLRLMDAVLPRMRERGRGTIINVTAGFGGVTVPGLGIYTASKFALESATDALRQEVSHLDVDVVTVQPGAVATNFPDRALTEVESIPHSDAYDDLYSVLGSVGAAQAGGPGINSPERVADAIHDAATARNPRATYRVGALATLGTLGGSLVRGRLRDRATRLGVRALASDGVQRRLRRRQRRTDATAPARPR